MWSEFEDGNGMFFIQRISLTGEFIDPRIPLPDVFGGPEWLDIAYTGREFGFTWVEREFDIGDEQRVHRSNAIWHGRNQPKTTRSFSGSM